MNDVNRVWEIVKNIHNKAIFGALIATTIKHWCMVNGVDILSYLQDIYDCTEEVERVLDND